MLKLSNLFCATLYNSGITYALADMVAVVLGCKVKSNHLWYHVFDQRALWNTYLTGFLYHSKISKEGLLYDCGVELFPDGQYGRQDYLEHANRGTFSLHSFYIILFLNFGSFAIGLLTQPEAQENIHGQIISEWLSLRHYCVAQLQTIWMHIQTNLYLKDEERSFLLVRCMKNFYEV